MECIIDADRSQYHVRAFSEDEGALVATSYCGVTVDLEQSDATVHARLADVHSVAREESIVPCQDCLAELSDEGAETFRLQSE